MSDIAKAYVQIVPTAEGIKGQLNNMLSGEAGEAGKNAGSKFGDGMKGVLGGVAKAAAGTFAATSAAVGSLAKSSVEAYANYEQLKGGVETLFGNDATKVLKNAESAYTTAGQSMNDYMESTIQSAAAMISSLEGDTATAADLMDLSIVDMSDNVNKMGTTMEGVQNAYRGFSRGNFTMLDNLALGYAGTKKGMQELLDKANELNKAQGNMTEYSIDSYADIVKAIHDVQTEMGITGTTYKEGVETISGSTANLKAAWDNLIAGFGKADADLDTLIGHVVEGAKTTLQNLQPIIEKALVGISDFISKAAPIVAQELPELIRNTFPSLLNAAVDIVNALALALPDIVSALADVLPSVLERLLSVMTENADNLVDSSVKMIDTIANAMIDNSDVLIPAAIELLAALAVALIDHLDELTVIAVKIVVGLADAIVGAREELAAIAPDLLGALAEGILEFDFSDIGLKTINKFIDAIQQFLPMLIPSGLDFIINLIQGIINGFDDLFNSGGDTVEKFGEGIENMISKSAEGWGGHLIEAFIKGIEFKHPLLTAAVNKVANIIAAPLHHTHPDTGVLADDYKWMPDMVDSFAQGINDNAWKLTTAVDSMAGNIYNAMPNAKKAVQNDAPTSAVAAAGIGNLTVPVYIAGRHFETAVINANQLSNYLSGGR